MDFAAVEENIVLELAECRRLLADAWVKLPIRWSKVDVGALVVDDRARLWLVERNDPSPNMTERHVVVQRIGDTKLYPRDVHAEAVVKVLMPVAERDALLMLRKELGANIMTPEQAAEQSEPG